jgi:hypothetical protein
MEQISPDIIERCVQSVGELNFIVNVKCLFVIVWAQLKFLH